MKNVLRLAFVGLGLFELLNYVQVLVFKLDFTWAGLMITGLFVVSLLELSNWWLRKLGASLHWSCWLFALAIVSVDAAGDIFHGYSRWSWYDQVAHFSGGAMATCLVLNVVIAYRKTFKVQYSSATTALFSYVFVVAMGAWYEIEEYLEDYFSGSHRLGDGPDTANDLLMNSLGAAVVVLVFLLVRYIWVRRQKNSANGEVVE